MNFESLTNDREARRNLARGKENFDRAPLVQSIENAAGDLSEETLTILAGEDEWDKNEFGPILQVWASDPLHSVDQLTNTLRLLKEIKSLESSEVADKEAKMADLYGQIWEQPENPPSRMV